LLCLEYLFHPGDQWKHELQMSVGSGTKHGSQLGSKHLGLVEANPNRAPTQERIGFCGRLERCRKLVAAEVERPQDHSLIREGASHPAVVFGLLILGWKTGAPRQEKLGPEEADSLGAESERRLDLLRQIYVPHQQDRIALGGDRWLARHHLQLELEAMTSADLNLCLFQLVAS